MRHFLFKAKKLGDGEWVSGNLLKQSASAMLNPCKAYIADHATGFYYDLEEGSFRLGGFVQVDPTTICQCTGIVDVHGEWIYENDLVTIPGSNKQGLPARVRWYEYLAAFVLERKGYNYILFDEDGETQYERIGNYYD